MKDHLERRARKPAVPSDFEQYLNVHQLNTFYYLQEFGWKMHFIRRPPFQQTTAVMINTDTNCICLLEKEGHVDMHPTLELRG